MLKDLSLTVRALLRQPVFTLGVVATLTLGIGATTAIFSTVHAVLLKPLPYPDPDTLLALGTAMTDGTVTTGKVAPVEIARLSDPALSVTKAAYTARVEGTVLDASGDPSPVAMYGVSEGFFDVFGLPMTLGRAFTHEEHVGKGPSFAVLSHGMWRDMFGSDPDIEGKTLRLADGPMTIVGVAARDLDLPAGADLWFNFRLDPRSTVHRYDGYLRARPGTTRDRLDSELAAVMAGLAREFPNEEAKRAYVARPLLEAIVGDLAPTLRVVLAAAALILILACVNVTNLLLARSVARSTEVAVRAALGAGRRRLTRELLLETLVLATAGAAAGVFVAYGAVRLLLVLGASRLPRLDAVPFDPPVLLFAIGVLIVTAVAVALAPAFRLTFTDIRSLLNDSSRSATGGRTGRRIFAAMIVAEVALAITLVAGAGLLVRGFSRLQQTNPGFASGGRVAVSVVLPTPKYPTPDRLAAWSREVIERLRGVPGVTRAASASSFPLGPERDTVWYVAPAGEVHDPARPRSGRVRRVSPGFFETMGIRMLGGRDFTWDDRTGAPLVAIVNRSFADRYFSGKDPLRERFAVGYPTVNAKNLFTIVGVVEDVKYESLGGAPEAAFYLSQAQVPYWQQTIVVATSLGDPATLLTQIRSAVRGSDPQVPVSLELVDNIVAASLNRPRLGMILMVLFAVAALALAASGIYTVTAYASAQRTGEIATRLALGASPRQVFWMMIGQGGRLTALGTIFGVAGGYAAARLASSQLQEVRASDPMTLVSAVASVLGITFVSMLVPAWRASRLDPARTLRPE